MARNKTPKVRVPGRASGHGRALAELRRSGAAGLHGKYRKDRANNNRRAIAAELRA